MGLGQRRADLGVKEGVRDQGSGISFPGLRTETWGTESLCWRQDCWNEHGKTDH